MIGEQICARWVNKLSLWADRIPRLPSYPSLRSKREPGNEVGLWTSVDCCYNHNSLRGRSRKEEGRRRKGGESPFSLSLFFSPPPPLYGPATRGHLGAFPLPPGWVVSPLVGPPPPPPAVCRQYASIHLRKERQKWSKVSCVRKHHDGKTPGPEDQTFEVLTIRPVRLLAIITDVNRLSPKGDQLQFSLTNINIHT